MHSTVAPWSRAACLLARCSAFALPSSACFECMRSILALSSRAVCLLARCNASALPKFCMLGAHAQHCGSLEPCCVPAGTVHCSCIAKVLHALNTCTTLWLSRAVLRACWHGVMHLHCQVLHALNACTTLWLSRAVLCACWHGAMHLHCQSFACLECMHSPVAPWSRAECLLARYNAVALPSFVSSACTALWLPGAVLRACWHGAMQLHCQVLHALNACTALWLSRAVLRARWHGAMHLHCQSSACLECMHS